MTSIADTVVPPSTDLHAVFGAGPLGRAVADALRSRGHRVRVVTRSGRADAEPGVETVRADAMDPVAATAACVGAAVVYQCAAPAYNRWPELFPRLQENVLQGAARAGAVLVAAENLYGYGTAGTLHERLPLAAHTRKGGVRAAMSERLFQAHARGEVRTVAGRASDFFGQGVRISSLGERLWPALLDGKALAWFGDPDAPHTFTYVPDFARALIQLGAQDHAWGRAWHVPSPKPLSLRQVVRKAAALAGVAEPAIRRTPKLALRAAGLFMPAAGELVEMGYSYEQPFIMSHAAYDAAFGDLATRWDDALTATLGWWREPGAAPLAAAG